MPLIHTVPDNETILKVFHQHGFILHGDIKESKQAQGRCPFCGNKDHFFINLLDKNRRWDCKKCMEAGGYLMFLQKKAEYNHTFLKSIAGKRVLDSFCKDRALDAKTILDSKIGYDPFLEHYTLPVYGVNGNILNLKIKKGKTFIGTSGCNQELYGLSVLNQHAENIYLCEGEWDCLALREAFRKVNDTLSQVVAVPGAGILKTTWIPWFNKKNATLCYDNDHAGKTGMEKAIKLLSPVVKELSFIHWPEELPSGFDIRDLYKNTGRVIPSFLRKLFSLKKKVEKSTKAVATKNVLSPGNGPIHPRLVSITFAMCSTNTIRLLT
jgi:hypothetical protein